ncbi:MAG: aldehyde dehydrogenase family protein [Deltaproteobacteria bacterium]|nr:MAG: aldehyde dehydrogenase family protein [Deltaproteobacteria bacterium]
MATLLKIASPRDGTPLGEVPATDPAKVQAIVESCRRAQAEWAATPLSERIARMKAARRRFLERAEAFVERITAENGKPEAEAWMSEIVPTADLFDYWLKNIRPHLARERVPLNPVNYPGKTAFIEYRPRGIIGLITPWNLPVAIPLRTLVPALLAGDGVVFKPSEFTPRCGALLAEVFEGMPLEVVQGAGEVGRALVEGGVDAVIFTGSVATGKKVASAAAERLLPCSVELGGKDAAIVLADADLDRAAHGIVWGALHFAGQDCSSVERVYVVREVADAFLKRVTEEVSRLRLGVEVGPLTTPAQLEIVERQVQEAVAKGAKVLCGGRRAPKEGLWFEPTVLTDVGEEMSILCEETFGPVLPVVIVEDAKEALSRVNASEYGLTASLWTRDVMAGWHLAAEVETGVFMVNNHSFTGAVPALPWSGVKRSGYGVTGSHLALESLVRPQVVLLDRSRAKREMWWFPYDEALLVAARALRDLALGRVGALGRLLGAFLRRFK